VATHYDVLGVTSTATSAEVRQAYRDRARRLHPDAIAGRPASEIAAARRAMQDLNEAWRVLRDPATRAAYDRSLRAPVTRSPSPPVEADDDDWFDRPYPHPVAESGDLTVVIVRALPWVAVLVVLGAIFVFTAYADRGGDESDLVGECISIENAVASQVPCSEPNDGRVMAVVDAQDQCIDATTARVDGGGHWFCLDPETGE
jgi:molecular chaperone DnaJ